MNDLTRWLDSQNIDYCVMDNEVVDIPEFGRLFRSRPYGREEYLPPAGR